MSENAFSDLARYYGALAEQLASEAKQADLLRNPTAVGTDREEVYRRFLERHVPRLCEVFRGGYVFNSEGIRSRQIDVIVTFGMTPRFEMGSGNQAIAPLEGTVAVAEVKSNLNKTTLYEALDNFSELPVSAEPGRALNPSVKPPPLERFWGFPFKIVFASSGVGNRRCIGISIITTSKTLIFPKNVDQVLFMYSANLFWFAFHQICKLENRMGR